MTSFLHRNLQFTRKVPRELQIHSVGLAFVEDWRAHGELLLVTVLKVEVFDVLS
jgi:hypothetical protein